MGYSMDKKVPFVVKVNGKRYASTSYDLDIVLDDSKLGSYRFDTKIKRYKDGYTKTTFCDSSIFGIRLDKKKSSPYPQEEEVAKKSYAQREVRGDNVKRAKDRIQELVLLNDFNYFVTVTFDDEIVDARDAQLVMIKLRNWLKNIVYRKNLRFLLVPEYHKKDKRIHAHLLINDVFDLVDSGTRIVKGYKKPIKLSTIKRLNIPDSDIKSVVYNVSDWKYGFSTAIPVYGERAALAYYLWKYISKDTDKIFGKRYWFSKNNLVYPVVQFETTYGFFSVDSKEYSAPCCAEKFKYADNLEVYNDDKFSLERVSEYTEIEI